MASQNFAECLRRVLLSEGGYTNNPRDPGGPTNWGITLLDARLHWKPNATADDVRDMPKEVAVQIYKPKYWDALSGDSLPSGLDYTVFDYGVNSGITRTGRVLRAVLGLPHSDALWAVDATVLNALQGADVTAVIDAVNAERLQFLMRLPTWPTFGNGWGRRVVAVKAFSRHLAEPQPVAPAHPSSPDASAKGYGDNEPLAVVPLPRPKPSETDPEAPQSGSVEPQSSPVVRPQDPTATQVAPQPKASTEAPPRAAWWKPWAAVGIGGSGTLDWLNQVNDYTSEISIAKFNLDSLHASSVFWWIVEHPVVLLPAVLIGCGAWLWEDHKKTKRLIAALAAAHFEELKHCSPSPPLPA